MFNKTDVLAVNTIRTLSIDQVEKAGAGHMGAPLGQAPMAHTLWTKHLRINPSNPSWFNRDRFILSSGHGSPMLYALLHLAGFNMSIDDLKGFRGYETKTPGHPEVSDTEGVEATTGPLGQGVSNAVGMAMAEAHLSALYNKEDFNIIDHFTYVIAGDGDLQEGIAQEATSLAGHLKLGKLIMLYDSNDIQLDGEISLAWSEDVKARYLANGWHYLLVEDGQNLEAINDAINQAKEVTDQPSIIEIKTTIGYGLPNEGTSDSHSDPVGPEGVAIARKKYEWQFEEDFYVPEEVYALYKNEIVEAGQKEEELWNQKIADYKELYPQLAIELEAGIKRELPNNWDIDLPTYEVGDSESTRDTSNKIINAIANRVRNLWGGSADLAASNKTMIANDEPFLPNTYEGRNIYFGVREFAMGGILNGILLHGGTWAYGGTFLVFSDYLRSAIRIAALSKLPVTYVFTHDSVILGFDGATHEPIEHLASYRSMPNLVVFRPADAYETMAAWEYSLKSQDRPVILALSRQALPVLDRSKEKAREAIGKGAYVVSDATGKNLEGIIIATGSEVPLAIEAQKVLEKQGKHVRVVSMPSMELFEEQSCEYKDLILPKHIKKRLAVEAGASLGWARYHGDHGTSISIDRFGKTGPGQQVYESFGFTVENIVETYNQL